VWAVGQLALNGFLGKCLPTKASRELAPTRYTTWFLACPSGECEILPALPTARFRFVLAFDAARRKAEFDRKDARMSHSWAAGTVFRRMELSVQQRDCPFCGSYMHVCCHRLRHLFTLDGPVELLLRLVSCPHEECAGQGRTYSPEAETAVAMPRWTLGWDVFCWLGHRRFSRHWSIPTLRAELHDRWQIDVSADAIEKHLRRYQTMLAARQSDLELLGREYREVGSVQLAIDGLQPEKGHETLYVVRELKQKRVWFAQALLSSASSEVRVLFEQARAWSEQLKVEVSGWMSDKQEAFVQGVAAVFPGVPHRFCENHFLRDLAKPMLEADNSAKVQLRRKVRGLRAIEREVLEQRRCSAAEASGPSAGQSVASKPEATCQPAADCAQLGSGAAGSATAGAAGSAPPAARPAVPEIAPSEPFAAERAAAGPSPSPLAGSPSTAAGSATAGAAGAAPPAARLVEVQSPTTSRAIQDRICLETFPEVDAVTVAGTRVGDDEPSPEDAGAVVLDYCAAVRAILNNDQGGPLRPPGLRMAEALGEVRASLERNLAAKKGGPRKDC
jgi:hypothetical protein